MFTGAFPHKRAILQKAATSRKEREKWVVAEFEF